MNKQFLKVGLVALMAGMYSAGASAAGPVSGDANATVEIALTLSQATAMDFGVMAPPAAGTSTITVDTANSRTASDATTLIGGAGATSGIFNIQGANAKAYTLSYATDAVLVHSVTPANTMTMLAASINDNAGALTGAAQTFNIGGTLTISAGQLEGSYSTTGGTPFTVTANYN